VNVWTKYPPSCRLVNRVMFMSTGATTENLPPGVLYRVKATYKYNREDVDELSFDVGEIVRVVDYDDPEEQVSRVLFTFSLCWGKYWKCKGRNP